MKLLTKAIGARHEAPPFEEPDMTKAGAWASWTPGLGPGTTQTLAGFKDVHPGLSIWSINKGGW